MSLFRPFYLLLLTLFVFSNKAVLAQPRDFHQIRIYHYSTDAQEKALDAFFSQAFIPAAHKAGISKVGVFKLGAVQDTSYKAVTKQLFVLLPFKSINDFLGLEPELGADDAYQEAGKAFLDAPYDSPPFDRMESILMTAFEKNPTFSLTTLKAAPKERVYELRSYEGATTKLSKNKIEMFNRGDEVGLFQRLNFNAVFYGEVVSGARMPNLMYMTAFENMADRDAHWDAFFKDPQWEKLKADPYFKNNVSKIVKIFLFPTDYSEI